MPTWVDIAAGRYDPNSPGDTGLLTDLIGDLEYLKAQNDAIGGCVTDQDIRDHFATGDASTGSNNVDTALWTKVAATPGNVSVQTEHQCQLLCGSNATTQWAVVHAITTRQRIVRSEEYVAIFEARVKRTGGNNTNYFFGWNDDGLSTGGTPETLASDVSDCVGFVIETVSGNWSARVSSGGTSSGSVALGTGASWTVLRMEFTCSATAGNRKVDIFVNGTYQSTISTNIPSVVLCPTLGVRGSGAGTAPTMLVDYAEFTFKSKPLAA